MKPSLADNVNKKQSSRSFVQKDAGAIGMEFSQAVRLTNTQLSRPNAFQKYVGRGG